MQETASQVIEDLTSRGALSGAASLLILAGTLFGWWIWTSRLKGKRRDLSTAILITGSRGKSSTVRLLHAALMAAGMRPYGKITGTEARELATDGSESPTWRLGAPSVLETFSSMRRAFRGSPPADALVFECMAVTPGLISLVTDEILRPDTTLITNAQLDHLEEEGSTPAEIATSLARAIGPGSLVVTGESDPDALEAVAERAGEREATLLVRSPEEVPAWILEELHWSHPQNVAIALTTTRNLGIEDEVAVEGMRNASREPGEREVWRRTLRGVEATYTDLGAINDPASLIQALESFEWPTGPDVPRIGLISSRWDRPLRALEFAGLIQPDWFDGLILAGGPVHPIRRTLLENGWDRRRILIAPRIRRLLPFWRSQMVKLARRADGNSGGLMLVSLENEHDSLAGTARDWFHGGTRLDGELERSRSNVDR